MLPLWIRLLPATVAAVVAILIMGMGIPPVGGLRDSWMTVGMTTCREIVILPAGKTKAQSTVSVPAAATSVEPAVAVAAALWTVEIVGAVATRVRAPAQPLVAPLSAMTPRAGGRWLVMSPMATSGRPGSNHGRPARLP